MRVLLCIAVLALAGCQCPFPPQQISLEVETPLGSGELAVGHPKDRDDSE